MPTHYTLWWSILWVGEVPRVTKTLQVEKCSVVMLCNCYILFGPGFVLITFQQFFFAVLYFILPIPYVS